MHTLKKYLEFIMGVAALIWILVLVFAIIILADALINGEQIYWLPPLWN